VTVLLVEDDPECLESMVDLLEDEQLSVARAQNGREALEYLGRHLNVQLIVLDLMMPVMDGWHFVREQQRTAALTHIPVLLVSAEAKLEETAAELQVAGHLRKPLELDMFVETVKKLRLVPG
jgi:two-component system, chemotaxis family, chemotaxis protein CheY